MKFTKPLDPVDRAAYKGYLILENKFQSNWTISKGGFHIGYCQSLEEGERIVDELTS